MQSHYAHYLGALNYFYELYSCARGAHKSLTTNNLQTHIYKLQFTNF